MEKDHNGVKEKPDIDTTYTVLQLGVWRVVKALETPFYRPSDYLKNASVMIPVLRRFLVDVYLISPRLFIFIAMTRFWSGLESTLLLYVSSDLLNVIEQAIVNKQPDIKAIIRAVLARAFCVVITSIVRWWCDRMLPRLQTQVQRHFEERLVLARLSYDLPTSQKNASRSRATSESAWQSFNVLIDFARELCSSIAQLGLIIQISRSDYGGPIFACLCLAQPLSDRLLRRSLHSSGHIAHANNEHYLRMQSLQELTGDYYRKDILAGNISNYIKDEYAKAQIKLGTVSDIDADMQYTQRDTPEYDILSGLIYDLPMLFYAVTAIHNPSKLTIASIAILQQASMSLRQTFDRLLYDVRQFPSHLNRIKLIYDTIEIGNEVSDGELTYPPDNDKPPSGMSFDVRDVSFEYPASESTRKALDKVSFSIKSGQLVVMVGANGSGKSTIFNLLNRLYDASSGNIFIDGQPINQYRVADLHQATATLSQEHRLFPLAVSENIGLGNISSVADLDMITESAKRGGSFSFISKLKHSLSTNLYPPRTAYIATFRDRSHPLWSIFEKLEKPVELSGGEKQRLVASRTFMRLTSDKVRFVAVDEPSSALDPQGELELFQRLREARSGRTMLFVTHRFGHLTKHADLILCMKDGTVAESGTHDELIEQNGEYARLYKIQAQAFVTE